MQTTRRFALALAGALACAGPVPPSVAPTPASPGPLEAGGASASASSGAIAPDPPDPPDPSDELRQRAEELRAAIEGRRIGAPAPDPAQVYSVPIDGDPVLGEAAPVTIVMVTQIHPACPFCTRVMPTVDQIQREYGSDVRIAWKQLVVHRDKASGHALAACAAHRQGRFFEMSARLLADDADEWSALKYHAKEVGLDIATFARNLGDPSCVREVMDEMERLGELGVRGVPSFFINGRFLAGAQPFLAFQKIIDEELKKARAAIDAGTSAADYYQSLVDNGLSQAP